MVRNQPHRRNSIGIRERHNERKNESYTNPDIVLSQSHLNVHFKHCEGTYLQTLDRMLQNKIASDRGLKPDAKVFGELVFDVNTAYFEEHGGYEYAKAFFEEAFRFAEKQVGSRYILSAVMHADEKNISLSEEVGRDVYHYHLHVIYVPIVQKEVKWSKRCKDKGLVGTTKEIINQISHSKKWGLVTAVDENGQPILDKDGKQQRIPSYSLLQDGFYTHMREAGFNDFERGIRGSTAEHLTAVEYKIEQDKQKLSQLQEKIQTQQSNLSAMQGQLKSAKVVYSTVREIDEMGSKTLTGKVALTKKEYEDLAVLAKEGITSRGIISRLREEKSDLSGRLWQLQDAWDRLYEQTREFREAVKLAPERVKEVFSDIFQKAREVREQRKMVHQHRPRGRER